MISNATDLKPQTRCLLILAAVFIVQSYSGLSHANQLQLYPRLDSEKIPEIAKSLGPDPRGYGPPCRDRKAWTDPRVVGLLRAQIARANELLQSSFPNWDDDAYLDYLRTGQRGRGEQMMQARLARLAPLVFAECIEYQGRFTAAIDMTLNELVRQRTWTLPAHDPHLNNYRGGPFSVDLAAAQQANEIAQALYMIADILPRNTKDKATNAIRQRILDPVRKSILKGHGSDWYQDNAWLVTRNNWNAVCLKGVLGSALAILKERLDRAFFVDTAETYSKYYIEGFSDDGYSPEGLHYWNYGFSRFTILRSLILSATSGRTDLFKNQKVQLVAEFGRRIQMRVNNVAAFGDSPLGEIPSQPLITFLDRTIFGRANTTEFEPLFFDGDLSNETIFLFQLPTAPIAAGTFIDEGNSPRTFFKNAGVYVGRPIKSSSCQLALTVKANGNTSHSHNDIGSYAIALGPTQPVGDPGGPKFYDRDTDGPNRYKYELYNSFGHPVPVVDGHGQKNAPSVKTGLMTSTFTETTDTLTVDLSPAYDLDPGALVRTLSYNREKCSITIKDEFAFVRPATFETAITTSGEWSSEESGRLLFVDGHSELVGKIIAPSDVTTTSERVDQYGVKFQRVALTMHRAQMSGFIEVEFAPVSLNIPNPAMP